MLKEKEFTEWMLKLVEALDFPEVFVNTEEKIVGYYYNRKKRQVHFITEKEAKKLTKKRIVWKALGEDWVFPKRKVEKEA